MSTHTIDPRTQSDEQIHRALKGCDWDIEWVINAMQEAQESGEPCEYSDTDLAELFKSRDKIWEEINRRKTRPMSEIIEQISAI